MIQISSEVKIKAKHPKDVIGKKDIGETIMIYVGHTVLITPGMVGMTAKRAYDTADMWR